MANILQKPWKTQKVKKGTSMKKYEERMAMKEEKKMKASIIKEKILEVRQKKKEYIQELERQKDLKKSKKTPKVRKN